MNQLQPRTYANKLSWCLGIVMTLLLAGCNSGDKDPILTPDTLTGLTQIVVNPVNPAIPAGLSRKFEALGVYADGTSINISDRVTWTSTTPAVATVNGSGMINAISTGTAVISAAVAGKSGQTTLTVTDAALVSITISPLAGTAIAGVNVQFSATGVYSNGTSQNLTSMVTWVSSDPAITSFNQDRMANSGLASALTAGVTTVTASMANISANTTFTVTAASLTGLVITPANPSVIVGLTHQMMVTGTFNNGNSVDLTTQAVWSSADVTLLTFNANGAANSGLATAFAAGTVAVAASFGGMNATGNVLVNQTQLTGLSIAPAIVAIAAGNSQQFIATGVYNNGTTANITSMVTWASSDIDVAYVNANLALDSGFVTSKVPGSAIVSASINSAMGLISNTANLTVSNAVVTSLRVSPATPLLINGFSQQLTATLFYSDQSTIDVTATAIWSSADTSIVTMNPSGATNSGLATPVMPGSALITATVDTTTSGSTQLSVVDATLQSIAIAPVMPGVAAGTSQQFLATGTFSNGSTINLNQYVDWQSSNMAVATFNPNLMNNSGLLSAIIMGNTDVTASFNGLTANNPVTITAANLVSVAVTPMTPAMRTGQSLQMQLIGTYTDNSLADLAASAVWSSSDTSVATINPNQQANSGLLSAIATGTTTLNASYSTADLQTHSSSTVLTVTSALATNPQAPELGAVTGFVMAASQGISTSLGSNSQFAGTVVSTQNIQLQTGATVEGRLLSVAGNIQLDANSITKSL